MNNVKELLPNHTYLYLGDTINLPYGPRDTEDIVRIITPCLRYLLDTQLCDHVVIACNTVSVRALSLFVSNYPQYQHRVHGIDVPTIPYLKEKNLESLLVLATQGTVNSQVYSHTALHTTEVAMPGLVEYIEQGDTEKAQQMCTTVINQHPEVHNVLLACTHYLWLRELLQQQYPQHNIIGQDTIISSYLSSFVVSDSNPEAPQYLVTGEPQGYIQKYHLPFQKVSIS